MTVSRDTLEAHIAQLVATVSNPAHGIYGPDSAMWKVSRESITFLGGGRAFVVDPDLGVYVVCDGMGATLRARSRVP